MSVGTVRDSVYRKLPVVQMFLVSLLALILFGGLAFVGSSWLKSSADKDQKQTETENLVVRDDLKIDLSLIKFHESGAEAIVPADVDQYLETSDLNQFGKMVPGTPLADGLLVGLAPISTDLSLSLSSQFSLIQKADQLAVILTIRDRGKVSSLVEKLKLAEPWKPYFLGDFLIFSNSEDLFVKVEDAFKKRSLPLNLDATFQGAVSRLPREGLLFVYSPLREKNQAPVTIESGQLKLIPAELKGVAFILQKGENEKVIIRGVENE